MASLFSVHAIAYVWILLLYLCVLGCSKSTAETAPASPLTVVVSYPVEREVTDYSDYTGRIAAVDSVEVRARVWGYLDKVNFKEGSLVKKGDVLFEIDPKLYESQANARTEQVSQSEAALQLARATNERYRSLFKSNPGAVSKQELDQYLAQENEAQANLQLSKANLDMAKLNLEWTKVRAPVSGRVSRYLVTVGNLVQSGDQAGGTLLTTIVSVDPIYAYFDVDERTVQRVGHSTRQGKSGSVPDAEWPVALGLATEEGFPHQGVINFIDNQVNPKTGTLRLRGMFSNKDETLTPGYFVRVRVPIGKPHKALLVSDRAVDTDQGQKVLYVVNDKKEVLSRPVRLGAMHDGLRAIEEGLKPMERVIVNGLQQVRSGMIVEPKIVPMPISGSKPNDAPGKSQSESLPVSKITP